MTEQAVSNDDRDASITDPILEVRNATVKFGMDRGESRVLDDVSIDIERNEILGVVGESGSGKSMFASAFLDAIVDPGTLSGEISYYPDSGGEVDVLGLTKSELNQFRWEEIAMVFQGAMSSFNPVRKINTHFVETLTAHGDTVSEGMERARTILSDLYMDPERVLRSYPHELSGGMKQRVLIALSLVLEPEVLVMDEPTAALDLLMQRSIISLIEDIKEKYDLTIVFITHDLPLVVDLADRIGVLYAFEFIEIGPANELLEEAAHPYTRALLKSTPNLTAPVDEMRPIEGSAPDPVNEISGCSYHSRCPMADQRCEVEDPGPYIVDTDHDVHCHYWEEASEAVPMPNDGSGTETGSPDSDQPISVQTPETRPRWAGENPVLSLDDVEVHFEATQDEGLLNLFTDPETVRAVDGISFDIYENDVVVLVGESGCGKTTLGKAAVGLERPTAGRVEYRGQDVWEAKETGGDIPFEDIRQSLQIVHQDPGNALNSYRKVFSSLEEPLVRWYDDLDGNDRRQRILSMLKHVGMSPPEDYIERYPHQLSGGEQQRVALIRAMLMNPDVILADEPVSALDVSLRVEMMDLMLELQDMFDTSYLFISHDLANARYITEKTDGLIGVVYLGKLVEIGTPERIINDPQHPYTRALCWATPELLTETDRTDDSPMRKIDIPDPTDPPSGCRYHTRCPEARDVCREVEPEMVDSGTDETHQRAACFRAQENHEYWTSESIVED
ncbi:ABC transporter ATP-binding protein [Halostagnicola sp. A-GB9-2]|uniref:ABC transporter ATP-binding protein n=1 Tax=Halostagnicola sp. A-GB9-2 TaxID=3048066 RepID=UPI0024BF64F8|nr:ABC transporter ATP-binding protein [Halostagnicola sp. A-GB9-2]MDJ1433632.1 ABC transporter ATP-binding protein [Halostagnicola sp. A-GB9-2]